MALLWQERTAHLDKDETVMGHVCCCSFRASAGPERAQSRLRTEYANKVKLFMAEKRLRRISAQAARLGSALHNSRPQEDDSRRILCWMSRSTISIDTCGRLEIATIILHLSVCNGLASLNSAASMVYLALSEGMLLIQRLRQSRGIGHVHNKHPTLVL
jgi:hypothetical protein